MKIAQNMPQKMPIKIQSNCYNGHKGCHIANQFSLILEKINTEVRAQLKTYRPSLKTSKPLLKTPDL